MNRREREVRTQEELFEILDQCKLCRLAMHDGEDIYIVPINFGYQVIESDDPTTEGLRLWFHGAKKGQKLDLLRKNPKVGFEMDCNIQLIESHSVCSFSYTYMSLVGRGSVTMVADDDYETKHMALKYIFEHQAKKQFPRLPESKLENITAYYVDVEDITGKKRD